MILHPPEKLHADGHGDRFLGIQVPSLPATVIKVAFSINFFKMLMYRTTQSAGESPPLIPTSAGPGLLLAGAVGKAGCKSQYWVK